MARYLILPALLLFLVFCPSLSGAFTFRYCDEPAPPTPPGARLPSPPICRSYDGDLSECSEWELQSYRDKIREYVDAFREYSERAARFADKAEDYARCRAEEADDEMKKILGEKW